MSQPLTYIDGTCQIGQREACGKPATNVIAVRSVKDVAWGDEAREGGVVLMCDDHAGTAANQWHTLACTCGRAWEGHPNPHAITCPQHDPAPDATNE